MEYTKLGTSKWDQSVLGVLENPRPETLLPVQLVSDKESNEL